MNRPRPPSFDDERRFRDALKLIDESSEAGGTFVDHLAGTAPVSYLLNYRLRWWQFCLHPRASAMVALTRRSDRRDGWQQRLDRYLRWAEGFIDGIEPESLRVYGLRYLQQHRRLSPFTVYCVSAKVTGASRDADGQEYRWTWAVAGFVARVICLLAAFCAMGLVAVAAVDLVVRGCASCVGFAAGVLAAQLAMISLTMFILTFYRSGALRRAREELHSTFGWVA